MYKGVLLGVTVGFIGTYLWLSSVATDSRVQQHKEIESEMGSEHAGHHTHDQRAVAVGTPVPTVAISVEPDAKSGYNLQISTEHFTFEPAAVNGAVVEGEGHAHVYVNGVKISRVYGEWFHLEATLFEVGENDVRVTLNAHDHSDWAVDGVPITSSVTVVR